MWFSNVWSAPSIWLRSRWATFRLAIASRSFPATSAVLVALLVGAVIYRFWWPIRDFVNRANDGEIIVNSPTVYTRQRLVNDRLNQTSWLQEQLKLADNDRAVQFRIIDQVQSRIDIRRTEGGMTTGASAPKPAAPTASDPPTGAGAPTPVKDAEPTNSPNELFGIQPTTADLFRAKNAYRDEVRGEMTQTQLDDRHDIRGNTIYRLSFDATIIAGSRTDAVAGVKVTLSHDPYGGTREDTSSFWSRIRSFVQPSAAEGREKSRQMLARLYQEDYEELYNDWMRYTQDLVSTSLESVTKSFLTGNPEPNARLLFSRFLLGRICEFAIGTAPSDHRINLACDPDGASEVQTIAQANRKQATELLNKYTAERSSLLEAFSLQNTAERLQQFNVKADAAQVNKAAKSFCSSNKERQIVSLLELGFQSVEDAMKFPAPPLIGCPFEPSAGERFMSGILLYDSLSALAATFQETSPTPSQLMDGGKVYEMLSRQKEAKCNMGNAGDKITCAFPDKNSAARCFAADYLKAKLNAFDRNDPDKRERIGYFFKIEVVGRETADCQIAISGDPREKKSKEARSSLADELKYLLNQSTETFSYSVTPKNLSENIATAAQTRDIFDMLARYGFRAGNDDALAFARKLSERSDRMQGILAHPIVVGFGSARHPPEPLKDPGDDAKSTVVIRETSFGWLIAPRSRVVNALEQIDGQYALTSVISVPSWWRSVELRIESCWLSREDLPSISGNGADDIEICEGQDKKIDTTVIRLPGAIAELSRKLGFEVLQQPHLSDDNKIQELEIGVPGSLLLKGGRLWRSTEVTLGAQRANSITVLPNMEGIIAHFSCVLPESGANRLDNDTLQRTASFRRITQTEVRVWTSEGVTSPAYVDLVWPDELSGPQAPDKERAKGARDASKQDNGKWCATHPEVFSAQ